jgi:hypothetical protein
VAALEYLVVFAILLAVVAFVLDSTLAELEAAREAKYRELRDADLDHRTGKLSDADYEELDRALRGEAITILHDLDRANIDPR